MTPRSGNIPSSLPGVLSITGFRNLWLAQILSQLAMNALIFVLGIRIFEQTGSNTAVSVLFLVYGIPAVFFGLVAGTIVDRFEKRRILLWCDLTRGILTLVFAMFPENLYLVYAFTFMNAVITQFYVPSEAPIIPLLVPASVLVIANSLFSFTYFSSLAIGSITAGPVLSAIGAKNTMFLFSGMFFLAALFVSRIKAVKTVVRFTEISDYHPGYLFGRIIAHMREGMTYLGENRTLKDALMLLLGTQVMLSILGALGPGFAVSVLEIAAADASLYILGPAVTGIVTGALWIGNYGFRYPVRRLIKTGIIAAGITLILISFSVKISHLPWFDSYLTKGAVLYLEMLLFFLFGISNSLLDVPANSILQSHAQGDMRGKVYGILTAGVGGIGVLPVVAGGLLADTIGVGKVIFILGAVVLVYGIRRLRYY